MPLDEKLPDRLLDTYLKCIASKDVLYYPSEVTREANELRVSGSGKRGGVRPRQRGSDDSCLCHDCLLIDNSPTF